MNENRKGFGILSAFATFMLLAVFTWYSGALRSTFNEFLLFISGDVQKIVRNHTPFLGMFPIILAAVVLELPCTFGGAILQSKLLGKHEGHALSEMFENLGAGHHFMSFFLVTLVEELFARWFFLGVLTKISFLSGTVALYILFLLGNGLWALIHLANFTQQKDKHPLRTLPQFIAGFFFAYVYVKFGLIATVLAHFASNAILFALHKVQRLNIIDALLIGYSLVCGVVCYSLLNKPLLDILPWFADKPTFVLPGWHFWDYIKVSIVLGSIPSVLLGLLAYDRGGAGPQDDEEKPGLIALVLATPVVLGLISLVYWLLGFVISEVPFRVLVLACLLSFLHKGASGSALARTFWFSLLDAYISICIMQALGFWASIGYALIVMALAVPSQLLLEMDD